VCLLCSPGGWLNPHCSVRRSMPVRVTVSYTTRWRLDFSKPPLKIAIASPVEPTSAGSTRNARNRRTKVADRVSRKRLVVGVFVSTAAHDRFG
jgi:hypothetical protein